MKTWEENYTIKFTIGEAGGIGEIKTTYWGKVYVNDREAGYCESFGVDTLRENLATLAKSFIDRE